MGRVSKFIFLVAVPVAILCLSSFQDCEAAKKNKVVTGVISVFDCEGSPCLLTVVDAKGKEHDGICSDSIPLCAKWNEDSKMPDEYKGKKVKVTVEESQGGHGRGSSDEFIKLELLK